MRFRELLLESNILNIKEIQQFTNEVAHMARNPRVTQYILTMLPSFLKKAYNRTVAVSFNDLQDYFQNIIPDWARNAASRNDLVKVQLDDALRETISGVIDFLESQDGQKHNLARIPFDQALKLSTEWHRKLAQPAQPIAGDTASGKILIKQYSDGNAWFKLTSPDALDYEGSCMGHCVGRGSYDAGVSGGTIQIFSLRDQKDQPHVTVEFQIEDNQWIVRQVKGKQNKVPIPKYKPYVLDLLNNIFSNTKSTYSNDLKGMGIFGGDNGYGDLLDVAKKIIKLKSGNLYVILGEYSHHKISTIVSCLATPSAHLLVTFEEEGKKLVGFQKLFNNISYKEISPDIKEILQYFPQVDNNAQYQLEKYFKFNGYNEFKLIDKDENYLAYHKNNQLIISDKEGHPHMRVSVEDSEFGRSSTYLEKDKEWVKTIPLLIKSYQQIWGEIYDKTLINHLAQAGWVKDYGKFIPVENLMATTEPFFKSKHGSWYSCDRTRNNPFSKLIFLVDRKPLLDFGVGEIYKRKTNSEPIALIENVNWVSDDIKPYQDDVIDIFLSQRADLPQDYEEAGFLLYGELDIFFDGNYFSIVDWDREVKIETTYYNILGDKTKVYNDKDSLFDAIQHYFYSDSSSEYQDILLRMEKTGYYKEEEVEYDFEPIPEDELIEYYDDPEFYLKTLKKSGKWKKKKLPDITKKEIWLHY